MWKGKKCYLFQCEQTPSPRFYLLLLLLLPRSLLLFPPDSRAHSMLRERPSNFFPSSASYASSASSALINLNKYFYKFFSSKTPFTHFLPLQSLSGRTRGKFIRFWNNNKRQSNYRLDN